MIAAFELNLQAMSLLALVVGLFLIYNTVTFSVVQRRGTLGIMRSLGTTRGQIFRFILLEAFILGLGRHGAGPGAGHHTRARRGRPGLADHQRSLFQRQRHRASASCRRRLAKGAVIGVSASLLAAALPAWDATRTPPAGIMKRSTEEETARRLLPVMTGGAVALNLLGFALLGADGNLALGFAALTMHRGGRRAFHTGGHDRGDAPAAAPGGGRSSAWSGGWRRARSSAP